MLWARKCRAPAAWAADAGSPVIDELTFADLLNSGVYERHLRRMLRHYRQRRGALLAGLSRHLPAAKVSGAAAGLHLMLTLPGEVSALAVVQAAAERDLALAPVERYQLTPHAAQPGRLVLGYGNIAPSAIDAAARRLAEAVTSAGS